MMNVDYFPIQYSERLCEKCTKYKNREPALVIEFARGAASGQEMFVHVRCLEKAILKAKTKAMR